MDDGGAVWLTVGHRVAHADHMTVDPYAPVPRYRQLAEIMRQRIDAGEFAAGARLPSERTLLQVYGVARETASKAMDVLRDEGVVVNVPGLGWYVAPTYRSEG